MAQPEEYRYGAGHLRWCQGAQEAKQPGRQGHRAAADQPLRVPDVHQLDDRARLKIPVHALDTGQKQGAAGAQTSLRISVYADRADGVGHAADPSLRRLQAGPDRSHHRSHPGPRIDAPGHHADFASRADHALDTAVPGPGGGAELGAHAAPAGAERARSEEHTSELQSQSNLVCRLLLEKKKKKYKTFMLLKKKKKKKKKNKS